MKKITLTLFMFIAYLSANAQFPAPYCAEAYGSGVEPITLVNFAGINNTSPNALGSTDNHQDFTSIIGNVVAGTTYTIILKGNTDGAFTSRFSLFVDWNNDNDFLDADESYNCGTIISSTGLDAVQATANILVPTTAIAGNHRMRVSKRFNTQPLPCNTLGYGQAEDYILTVTIPSCTGPSTLVASAITPTTGTISWTAPVLAPANGYDYYLSTVNTAPIATTVPTGTTAVGVVTTNLTSLTSATNYYFWVRSKCSSSSLSTWSPGNFVTACAIFTTPFAENFGTFLPLCWSNLSGGDLVAGPTATVGTFWGAVGFANVGATGAAGINIYTSNRNDWLITPVITIPATGYALKFDAAAVQYADVIAPTTPWEADDKIEVLVSTTGTTNWTVLFTYDNTNQPGITATPKTIPLSAYSGQNVRIAFRGVEGTANGSADIDFSIDNIQVILNSLATSSFNNEGFSYYPNPVVDYLKLSYTQNIDKVEVMNMLGQVVLVKTINSNESNLDMSSLAKGTYMVKVAADNQIKTIKVIKE